MKTIEDYRRSNVLFRWTLYPILFRNTPPHSHSIVPQPRKGLFLFT